MTNFRNKLGNGGYGNYGQGYNLQSVPNSKPVGWSDFSGGFVSADRPEDLPQNVTADALDMEVDRKDRLVVSPGATLTDTLATRTVKEMAVHASLDYSSELVLFDPPFIGVKRDAGVTWYDVGLKQGDQPIAWTNFGATLIFCGGLGPVLARQPGGTTVETLEEAPQGTDYATFAGRVFMGGGVIDGRWEPLGISWSSANSNYRDWTGLGSGFELLINDMSSGDFIVALRPMGFDFMAVICRKSIWIGRRTGLRDRPADFQPRVPKLGFIHRRAVVGTPQGIVGLADTGVYIFDGNGVQLISEAINPEILPLDITVLDDYSLAFNPVMQHVYLFTPGGTWVYDLQRQRWSRRSLVASAGVAFAEQLPGTTWGQLAAAATTWGALTDPWMSLSPAETENVDFYILKSGTPDSVLGIEDAAATGNFGVALTPYWELPALEGEFLNSVLTVKQILVEYEVGGTIDLWLPDIEGTLFEVITARVLRASASRKTQVVFANHTGKGVQVRLEVAAGKPRIAKVQAIVLPRAQRIEGTNFVPREYYNDFQG